MKKIVIIDDDRELVESVSELLKISGYEVYSASNGTDGFNLCADENPDLILLDVMMDTKTEGIELSKKLHQHKKLREIPVILVTGIRSDMNLPFGLEADEEYLPVVKVLEKPVRPDKLLGTIKEMIMN